jgi:hypothetical protein
MKRLQRLSVIATFLLPALAGPSATLAQSRRGVTPEDYYSFEFIGDPHLSPDGNNLIVSKRRHESAGLHCWRGLLLPRL